MNILWSVNSLSPKVAKILRKSSGHPISWVEAMSEYLVNDQNLSLHIVTKSNVHALETHKICGITYYLMPMDCHKIDYWAELIQKVSPDIIHVYGTESFHNRLLFEKYSEACPIIVSLQGIVSEYYHHAYASIPHREMLKYTTLKDLFRPCGFFSSKRAYKKAIPNERFVLNKTKYVEGRSTWDRVSSMNINPNLQYYYCPRMIRPVFYERDWDISKIERHSLFVHRGNDPIKGLHFVIEAIAKLKKKYPDIKLYIAGPNYLEQKSGLKGFFSEGYQVYLRTLINNFKLQNNLCFTGPMSSNELVDSMSKKHIVIVPSSIENAPNSLAEAMIVGVPCIASFVGGNMDMLDHNREGFLYAYNEPNMLAEYISRIFDSDELANRFSKASKKTARQRHDPETLKYTLLSIYQSIIENEKKA